MTSFIKHCVRAFRCAQKYGLTLPPETIKAIATITYIMEEDLER